MDDGKYQLILKQLKELLFIETNYLANAANLASFLYHSLDDINWLGFYFYHQKQLVLGPFYGQPACTRIEIGKGVCGTAFQQKTTVLVDDVDAFSGHIVCDANSRSEIVVPFEHQIVQGVLDVDSPIIGRFSSSEQFFFEQAITIFLDSIC